MANGTDDGIPVRIAALEVDRLHRTFLEDARTREELPQRFAALEAKFKRLVSLVGEMGSGMGRIRAEVTYNKRVLVALTKELGRMRAVKRSRSPKSVSRLRPGVCGR